MGFLGYNNDTTGLKLFYIGAWQDGSSDLENLRLQAALQGLFLGGSVDVLVQHQTVGEEETEERESISIGGFHRHSSLYTQFHF